MRSEHVLRPATKNLTQVGSGNINLPIRVSERNSILRVGGKRRPSVQAHPKAGYHSVCGKRRSQPISANRSRARSDWRVFWRVDANSSKNINDIRCIWRRERDSNPRYGFPYTHFPGVRLQPLGHPSVPTLLSVEVRRRNFEAAGASCFGQVSLLARQGVRYHEAVGRRKASCEIRRGWPCINRRGVESVAEIAPPHYL